MEEDAKNRIRTRRRYNHVSIPLRIKIGDDWMRIRANDWNEVGFNFHLDHDICDSLLEFRKGALRFSGSLVWSLKDEDDDHILETILNTLLTKNMDRFADSRHSMARMIAMIRAGGYVQQKKKLLATVGLGLSPADEQALILEYKNKHSSCRYGARVESKEWSGIVRQTIENAPDFTKNQELRTKPTTYR